jgi:hypothetical protein
MPGNVQLAVPIGVLPKGLSTAYSRQKHWEMRTNWFPDGSHVRGSMVSSDQSTWSLSRRLVASATVELRTFYFAHQGAHIPFYFYDWYESHFSYDPTGVSGVGRYTVRFAGPFATTLDFSRSETPFTLVQVV